MNWNQNKCLYHHWAMNYGLLWANVLYLTILYTKQNHFNNCLNVMTIIMGRMQTDFKSYSKNVLHPCKPLLNFSKLSSNIKKRFAWGRIYNRGQLQKNIIIHFSYIIHVSWIAMNSNVDIKHMFSCGFKPLFDHNLTYNTHYHHCSYRRKCKRLCQ